MIGHVLELAHFVEFALLYLLIILALSVNGVFTRRTNTIALWIAILYGCVDEIHQAFVPHRSATLSDVWKDSVGVFIAYYFVKRKMFTHKVQATELKRSIKS